MYAKIFAQIYDGTLCTNHPWQALVTFQQLLVLADQDGSVDMTARAISRRTGIPIEIIELGIAELLKPDPESRTPEEEGRRIIPLVSGRDWGWKVVNYVAYRNLKREEDRREYHRRYYQQKRSAAALSTQNVETQHPQQIQPIAYAEANEVNPLVANAPVNGEPLTPVDKSPKAVNCPYDDLIFMFNRDCKSLPRVKVRTPARDKAIASLWKQIQSMEGHDGTEATLQYFADFFYRVERSDFLCGRGNSPRPFVACWDWITKPANFTKIIEGNYDNERRKK